MVRAVVVRIEHAWRSSKGQNLVEFALLAPIVFILLFGIIDFGMSLDHRITIQHAVREGARYAAVHPGSGSGCLQIQQLVADRASDIDAAQVGVHYFKADGVTPTTSPAAGDTVKVTAPFDWDFRLVGRFGVGAISKRVPASARLEMAVPNVAGCGP